MIRAPRCPYCHDGVSRGESLVVCRECHAFHHSACFEEATGCAACSRRALLFAGAPTTRVRRLAGAIAIFFAFAFGQIVGAGVFTGMRDEEPAPLRKCEQCCPRHHHHCH